MLTWTFNSKLYCNSAEPFTFKLPMQTRLKSVPILQSFCDFLHCRQFSKRGKVITLKALTL